jgi:hypothetical protein
VNDPNLPECEEALINDIEDLTIANWGFLSLQMPALPYTCTKKAGGGRPIVGDGGHTTNFTSSINWAIHLSSTLRSFLIGRHTASADVLGSFTPAGFNIVSTTWTGTSINYLFNEGSTEVMASTGSTGVADLGAVAFSTPFGPFWNATMRIQLDLADGDWDCLIGPPGATIRRTGRNTVVGDYPISWTPVNAVLAEAIRNQFRTAVRIAVTGSP